MNRYETGIAVLEFVLSLPILIVCLLSILYYGIAFAIYRTGIDAAYVGAQAAVTQAPLAGDPLGSSAARDAAGRVAAGYTGNSSPGESGSGVCLAPGAGLVAAGGNDYRYVVTIDFSACRVLQRLSVDLPFLGRLPPLPGNVAVSASVTL